MFEVRPPPPFCSWPPSSSFTCFVLLPPFKLLWPFPFHFSLSINLSVLHPPAPPTAAFHLHWGWGGWGAGHGELWGNLSSYPLSFPIKEHSLVLFNEKKSRKVKKSQTYKFVVNPIFLFPLNMSFFLPLIHIVISKMIKCKQTQEAKTFERLAFHIHLCTCTCPFPVAAVGR